ncbi:hypothetical protein L596_022392 [Steinernema carpocapsae]|uniref:Uncharacterized protein n=1 Tax=Steinernema carpocapsae TaxID=34508 RepID=A0A4V6A068_STECR|nr:hypothetical protein L596_022392 [Steinernema carpocapsae]
MRCCKYGQETFNAVQYHVYDAVIHTEQNFGNGYKKTLWDKGTRNPYDGIFYQHNFQALQANYTDKKTHDTMIYSTVCYYWCVTHRLGVDGGRNCTYGTVPFPKFRFFHLVNMTDPAYNSEMLKKMEEGYQEPKNHKPPVEHKDPVLPEWTDKDEEELNNKPKLKRTKKKLMMQ